MLRVFSDPVPCFLMLFGSDNPGLRQFLTVYRLVTRKQIPINIDSIQLIRIVKRMRDEKEFASGDRMDVEPHLFIGAAKYMKNKVPGMDVPDSLIDRLSKVPKEDVSKEGIKIAVETIQRLQRIEGVSGVHIMAVEWEEIVPEIVKQAGLYPRP